MSKSKRPMPPSEPVEILTAAERVARAVELENARLKRLELHVDLLAWDLKRPCDDCPFKKSTPFHGGIAENVATVSQMIDEQRFAHTCHKTDNRPMVDGPRDSTGPIQHCAGATLMLLKTGNGVDLQRPLLRAAESKRLDLEDMMQRARRDREVFTLDEYKRFYLRALAHRARVGKCWRSIPMRRLFRFALGENCKPHTSRSRK